MKVRMLQTVNGALVGRYTGEEFTALYPVSSEGIVMRARSLPTEVPVHVENEFDRIGAHPSTAPKRKSLGSFVGLPTE